MDTSSSSQSTRVFEKRNGSGYHCFMINIVKRLFVFFSLVLLSASVLIAAREIQVPPNLPGRLTIDGDQIQLLYDGKPIVQLQVVSPPDRYRTQVISDRSGNRISQILVLTASGRGQPIVLEGQFNGSDEAFPCEAEPRVSGLKVVRHSVGMSHSLLNRAVYDRGNDWLISIDFNPEVQITPDQETAGLHRFGIRISGPEIVIRFRPRFYQQHRGLSYYEPWTYRIWQQPIVGWCSWFAYFKDISEENIKNTADVLADVLLPFGFDYLQIDDGYQRGQGLPQLWLQPNDKFPGGLARLAAYISGRGLKPGIWTNTAFNQLDFARQNRQHFVLNSSGEPASGNWVDLIVDGSNPVTLDTLVRPIYSGLRKMGWQYFKVDALRHLRYEGYNSYPEHFSKKDVDRVDAYRRYVQSIREEIGRDYFMLGCWGIRPELIGIIDGCRIGTDGYSFAGLSQYNSFNNVVWLNDPDHIELSPDEAYRSTMVTSLTGSLFLLTDKPEVYLTERVEPAKRSAPVLFTLPGQVYDVDPSRSSRLNRVDVEVSGSGTRVFEASRTTSVHLYLLEINKSFERWCLLGRTGGSGQAIAFSELGLDPRREYLLFEFWSKQLVGSYFEKFTPGPINPDFNCQLFCIRERLQRPQFVASSRHITCGGFDLEDLKWSKTTLSGSSQLVARDSYTIYLTEPPGYSFSTVECNGAKVLKNEKRGSLRLVQLLSETGGRVEWSVKYGEPGSGY